MPCYNDFMAKLHKPVVLVVLDGVGVNPNAPQSTWRYASTPIFRDIEQYFPFSTLQASGASVGLPWGEEGNSEVGHLTMGAGRMFYHHLPRIISSIHDKSFFNNEVFLNATKKVKDRSSALHLMGLYSTGSVHAYKEHLLALLEMANQQKVEKVYLHLFTDGRDAAPKEAAILFGELSEIIARSYQFAQIASVSGRRFAMDRDGHWDRIEKIYRCLVNGEGEKFSSVVQYINDAYADDLTDEYIEPGLIVDGGRIQSGDAVIFFNFREDSALEITKAFVDEKFDGFVRQKLTDLTFVTMTQYDPKLKIEAAFPPLDVNWPLARVISEAGMKQLHIAETEKYAHVTYFFNGGIEEPFPNEERILVPSLKVTRFDTVPEMSAEKITEIVKQNIDKQDFMLVNFANGDMVGHTGNFDSTAKALEALDFSIGSIKDAVIKQGGVLVITADHGNAEEKLYDSGNVRTKHSSNPVPFFLIAEEYRKKVPLSDEDILSKYKVSGGMLSDVAPTIIELLGLRSPAEMTGVSLLEKLLNE
jgi:2,3-bisphosphoglycerate-independent phosphoglycerate mutase